jgi:acyl transferase domain-containing protein/NADPH:quinone reductase-like Zn-dependent oxidoreductase/SAM-dependent methyltransferase
MNVAEPDHHKLLSDAFTAIKQLRQRVEELESAKSEPIAVVGMGCRFAPDIDSPEAFWELLARGGNAVTEIPRDRWDNDFYYDPNTDAPGKICTRHGGFLQHNDLFDPQFFKISPREASYMDPQQRLLLEVAWEALENANIPPDQLYGSDGGVFVGISSFDYANLVSEFLPYEEIDPTVGTGIGLSPASGRISYVLGLQGPSICLDTACSSSLVAVHTACESLRKQECSIALAGGVNMILSPLCHVVFSKSHMLSRDGLCKTFDESADGFARSEGAGLLVLKRLKDAVANQNRVLALIRGGAVNQDGASGGLSVPNGPAQQKVIRKALRNAGLKAEDVDYVEAHGTGTALGDPIEMNALGMVFRESHTASRPLWVGSAKTNLGHMESAAGVGGLIKTILQLQKGVIAPHLNFKQPSSRIAWGQLPVQVPTTVVPWPSQEGRKRIAGVSAFGFSGTNAHLLLEAAPEPEPRPRPLERGRHVLVLSAKNESSLRELALSYSSVLERQPQWSFSDICHSASAGRTHFTHRAAIVATSASELKEKLRLLHGGESAEPVLHGCVADDEVAKVAFLFTGQGSQYYAMGRELYHSQPLFRDALHQCDEILSQNTGWSLLDLLYSSTDHSQIHQTAYSQPLLFSIEFALARLWQSWGIQPAVVMGHSVGEYAAAVIAGVFSLEDGLKLIAARGKLMQALPRNGGMIAIQGKLEKVAAIVAACGSSISIAAINGPHSIVISGPQDELLKAAAACQREHLSFTQLEVSHAFHSPLMSPILADFARVAEEVAYSSPHIDFVSNVTGKLAAEALANAEYWVRHISAPVLFYDGIQQLSQRGCKIILEIGPKPTLIDLGRNCVEQDLQWLASLRPGCSDWEQMLQSLATMYVTGSTINWEQVNHGYYRDQVSLPTYRFQRERYWFAPHVTQKKPATPTGDSHPLLGRRLSTRETAAKQVIFESSLGKNLAYLMDHRVLGRPLFPAAGYIEAAVAAGHAVLGGPPVLRNFVLQRPLLLSESGPKKLRTVIEQGPADCYTFKILSKEEEDDTGFSADWILHAQGVLVRDSGEPPSASSLDLLRDGDSQDVDAYYENLRQRGLEFGAAFRTIRELRTQGRASIGLIALPHEFDPLAERYTLHPTVLDGAFQVLGTALTGTGEGGSYLPLGFESLRLLKKTGSRQWACVVRRAPDEGGARAVVADVIVYDTDGTPAVIVSGFRIVPTTAAALKQSLEGDPAEFLYQFSWTRRSQLEEPRRQIEPPGFLIFADRGGVAQRIALKLQETGCHSALVYAEEQQNTRTDEGTACTINPSCPSDFVQVLGDAKENSHRATLYFWGLDVPAAEEDREIFFEANHFLGCGPLLNLVSAISSRSTPGSPSLFVFTRNAFASDTKSRVNAAEAALTGLARQIGIEHPSLRCTQVDLDADGVAEIETRQIVAEVLSADGEEQVALRSGLRFSPRLTAVKNPRSGAMAGPVQVTVNGYGAFESLGLETLKRRAPQRGEVEVAVRAAAINFKDVLHVLGMLKEHALQKGLEWVDCRTLGRECSGTIVAVGDGVSDKKIGDAVICLGRDCLSSYVTVASDQVFPKPKNATFEEAAALPIAFLTAHHVLSTQAKVAPGDRVLVHAGAGSVGQAAIQLCRKAGAEVFATASPPKWDFLKSQGIKHVMNSRNTEFANQILELTNGRGVDVVLNSLSGEFIPSSLETLASGGRFVEIGKLDIWTPEQVAQSRPDVSYFTVDMDETTQDVLDGFNAALNQVTAWIDQGSIQALPVEIFQVAELGAAFRHLAQGRNVGKVVLSFPALEAADVKKAPVYADGCYWITGGLEDLGLKVAEWLVEQGARHLVLSGTEPPAADATAVISRMQTQGARVEAVTANVSRRDEVLRVLEGIDRSAVCLCGIIHIAGVVKDGMLQDQDWNRFRGVIAPEIAGAWNLHTLTHERHLDFFVCFSSLAGVLGSKGKGEYAAASTFIDALMHHRKSIGLPGVALDWGPWVLRNKKFQDLMVGEGVQPIPVSRALSILEYGLRFDQPQVVAAAIDWREFAECYRARSAPRLLEAFVQASTASEPEAVHGHDADNILSKLKNASFPERHEIVLSKVRKTLAETLRLRSAESVRVNQPLADLGIDSLMAIEVRNLLRAAFGCELSSSVVFDHPTANALTAHLIQTIFPGESTATTPVEQPVATAELDRSPNHSITKTKGEASLQVLVPIWNPVHVDASKRVAVSESAKILLLGDDQAHLDWLRKCYPNSELLRLDLTSNLDAFAKALAGGSFDQLLWIAPDVSLNCNREIAHELIIEQQEQGVLAVFRIIKALLALGYADQKLHWSIITGNTQQVTAADPIEPRHSGVVGLVGSLAKEHPRWGLRLLDLDSLASVSAQECLSLPWDKRGDGLAYRRGEWFHPGLARITTPPVESPVYRRNGVYIVIGGAGGLGEVWSRFMIENYRANIIWIGRRECNAEIQSKIDALAQLGSAPLYIAADATNLSALGEARETVLRRYPAIHGVVHSAIVLHDQSIARMDDAVFRTSFSAKLDISVNMDKVFGEQELDFMLFFSSLSSFVRSAGQANYSAGCTFKDSFAHKLQQERPYPVRVMNWGYWGSVGIVADAFHGKNMAQRGIGSIEPHEGMASLKILVNSNVPQMGVIKAINSQKIAELNLSETVTYYSETVPAVTPQVHPALAQKTRVQSVGDLELLTPEILHLVTELLAANLKSLGLFSNGLHRVADLSLDKLPAQYFERWLTSTIYHLQEQKVLGNGLVFMREITALADLWAEWETRKAVWVADPNLKAPIALLEVCLKALPEVLTGKRRATDVIFPDFSMSLVDGIYRDNTNVDYFNAVLGEALVSFIERELQADKSRMIRILEIGAGTGGTTVKLMPLLQKLPIAEYCYTDVSRAFLTYAEKHHQPGFPALSMAVFDASKPIAPQSIAGDYYDVVIAANVLHATRNIRETLRNAKATLKKRGVLLLYEISAWSLFSHLTFGLLEGWWLHEDTAVRLPGSPALAPEKWRQILQEEGFESISFPAEEAHISGQQIIVAASDGCVRQRMEWPDQPFKAIAENIRDENSSSEFFAPGPLASFQVKPWSGSRVQAQ